MPVATLNLFCRLGALSATATACARSTRTPTARCSARASAWWCSSGWPTRSATATASTPSIRGVGVASDGRATGVMAPRVEGEELALRRAYEASGIDPRSVGLIEAHGTGTAVGDATEIEALARVFGGRDGRAAPLRARHGQVDDQPHHPGRRRGRGDQGRARPAPARAAADAVRRAQPEARARAHAVLPQHRDAPVDPRRRRAAPRRRQRLRLRRHQRARHPRGVRRHGRHRPPAALGQRARAARGATPRTGSRTPPRSWPRPWRASPATRSPTSRSRSAGRSAGASGRCASASSPSPSTTCGRSSGTRRRSCATRTRSALKVVSGIYYAARAAGPRGQGRARLPGRGRPVPGHAVGPVPALRRGAGGVRPRRPPLRRPSPRRPAERLGVPAAGGLGGRARARGGAPDAARHRRRVGPDGERRHVRAAHAPARPGRRGARPQHRRALRRDRDGPARRRERRGLVAFSQGLYRAYAAAAERHDIPGAVLLALGTDAATALDIAAEAGGELHLAMDNCPHQAVLVGEAAAAARAREIAAGRGLVCEELPYDRAVHTPMFAPFADDLRAVFDGLPVGRAHTPLWSCTTAAPYPDEPAAIRELLVEHWTRPVRFRETIDALYADGARIFVEAGPRGNMTAFIERHPARPAGVRGGVRRAPPRGRHAAQPPGRPAGRARRRRGRRSPVRAARAARGRLARPAASRRRRSARRCRCTRAGRCSRLSQEAVDRFRAHAGPPAASVHPAPPLAPAAANGNGSGNGHAAPALAPAVAARRPRPPRPRRSSRSPRPRRRRTTTTRPPWSRTTCGRWSGSSRPATR